VSALLADSRLVAECIGGTLVGLGLIGIGILARLR
jgi:hypothetical protein